MKSNFSLAKWEELLEMLPNRGEGEITGHASELGLVRESEELEPYYDEIREGWVQTRISYGKIKSTVSSFIPVKKGTTLNEANEKVAENMAKAFGNQINPMYNKFILDIGLRYDTEKMRSIFNMRYTDLFFASGKNDDEKNEIVNKYNEEILKEVKRVNKE